MTERRLVAGWCPHCRVWVKSELPAGVGRGAFGPRPLSPEPPAGVRTVAVSVAMPTNLYGPGDNFDLLDSHVIPAMIRKFHQAKVAGDPEVVVWGTGTSRREFLYVDDLAYACLFLMENYQDGEIINGGVGQDVQIMELARQVAAVTGFSGRIVLDPSYPDGTPRKLLDVNRITALGWQARTPLHEGLHKAYDWFRRSPWTQKP